MRWFLHCGIVYIGLGSKNDVVNKQVEGTNGNVIRYID